MLARGGFDRLGLLHVVGEDQRRDRALGERDPYRSVDQMARLRRVDARLDVGGDVLEERVEVDLLLVARSERHAALLPDDRHDRRAVELRVVEPVQEVDGPRAGGGQAHTDLIRELRVAAGHERGHLLVADLDEPRVAVGAVERAEKAVDAVAGIPEQTVDAPLAEALQNEIGSRLHWIDRYPLGPVENAPESRLFYGLSCGFPSAGAG